MGKMFKKPGWGCLYRVEIAKKNSKHVHQCVFFDRKKVEILQNSGIQLTVGDKTLESKIRKFQTIPFRNEGVTVFFIKCFTMNPVGSCYDCFLWWNERNNPVFRVYPSLQSGTGLTANAKPFFRFATKWRYNDDIIIPSLNFFQNLFLELEIFLFQFDRFFPFRNWPKASSGKWTCFSIDSYVRSKVRPRYHCLRCQILLAIYSQLSSLN